MDCEICYESPPSSGTGAPQGGVPPFPQRTTTSRKERMTEAAAQAAGATSAPLPLSRREFLYYMWGASMAVFMAGTGGALIWFALPRFLPGGYRGRGKSPR